MGSSAAADTLSSLSTILESQWVTTLSMAVSVSSNFFLSILLLISASFLEGLLIYLLITRDALSTLDVEDENIFSNASHFYHCPSTSEEWFAEGDCARVRVSVEDLLNELAIAMGQ